MLELPIQIVMSNNICEYLHLELKLNDEQIKQIVSSMKILNKTNPENVRINSIFFDKSIIEDVVKFKK